MSDLAQTDVEIEPETATEAELEDAGELETVAELGGVAELETAQSEAGAEAEDPDSGPRRSPLQAARDRKADEIRQDRAAHYALRRKWISRGIVTAAVAVNAMFSLHLQNTAFMDEAGYIAAGHLQLDHLLHGVPETIGFEKYFSGVPVLYPVLAGLIDSVGGLVAVRLFSLLCIAGAMLLLYSFTRRLFNERVACCAVAVYAIVEPTIFLANFAAFDAPVIFLLAFALWIVVFGARTRRPWYLFAIPVLALAAGFKYFALVFTLPTAAVAGIVAASFLGPRALWRGAVVAVGTLGLVAGAFAAGGHQFFQGALTNLTRVHGNVAAAHILSLSERWAGLPAVLGVIGAACYAVRARTELSVAEAEHSPRLAVRIALGVVLAGTAFVPTLSAIRISSTESLNRHVGYGLLFAAPMMGVGLARIIADHFRRIQIGIAVWIVLLVLGVQQATAQYATWRDSTPVNTVLAAYYQPGDKLLVDVYEPEIYYLHAWDDWSNWYDGYSMRYQAKNGKILWNDQAYDQAVTDGYFDVIATDKSNATTMSYTKLTAAINASNKYRLVAVLPSGTQAAPYYVWVKQRR
jgi:hypothetical protein